MKLVGLMPVRNEAWVLGLSLRVALQWCDEVVVFMHACTDGTVGIVNDIYKEGGYTRIHPMADADTSWNEMSHRQSMLLEARRHGATHIAIIDADEIVTGNLSQVTGGFGAASVRAFIRDTPKGSILQLPLYNLRGSLDRYHANGIWGERWLSVGFQDDPRLNWTGDRFHAREPQGMLLKPYRPIVQGRGGAMHLWGVSERRLTAKHALYKATERLRFPRKPVREIELMYNLWRSPADSVAMYPQVKDWHKAWEFRNVPKEWWQAHEHLTAPDGNVDLRGEPWQEAEVRRLVKEHGLATFQHLDLFGIA